MRRRLLQLAYASSMLLAPTAIADAEQMVIFRATPKTYEAEQLLALSAPASASLAYAGAWNFSFVPSGGAPPYVLSLAAGTAPSGIATGTDGSFTLAGRTTSGSYGPFRVVVSDSKGRTAEAVLASVTVAAAQAPFAFSPSQTSYRFAKGADWAIPYTASGGAAPYSFVVPQGLSATQDPSSGLTVNGSGVAGVYSVPSISAKDAAGASAVAPAVVVTVGTDAALSVASSSTGFAATPASSPSRTIVVSNTGDLTTAATPTPTVSGSFVRVSTTCTSPLPGGQDCNVVVAPNASSDGALSGSISYAGTTAVTTLSGTASGYVKTASMSPSSADVSITNGTTASSKKSFTVTNTGPIPTAGLAWSVRDTTSASSSSSGWFAASAGTCVSGSPLAVGASCTIDVVRNATGNDATSYTQYLHVSYGGTSGLMSTLTGTSSGFYNCSTPGGNCPDGSIYLGNFSGKNSYAKVGASNTVQWALRNVCPSGFVVPPTSIIGTSLGTSLSAALPKLGLYSSWLNQEYSSTKGWWVNGSGFTDAPKTSSYQVACITA